MTRIIGVPTFRSSKSIILCDLQTLQSYEYKFNVSNLVKVPEANELEFNPDKDSKLEKCNLILSEDDSI